MDQISPPMRIALLAAIIFAAAWFTVLKPGGDVAAEEPAPAAATATVAPAASDPNGPTAQSASGRAAQAARGAVQTQEQADARSGAAADAAGSAPAAPSAAATTAPSAGAAAAPATAAATPSAAGAEQPSRAAARTGLPMPVARGLARGDVVVLLFWNPAGSDDRAVRRAVRGLAEPGKVVVQVAPVSRVSRYAPITQGVDLSRSPAVVVIDGQRRAQLLSGYVARDTIRQAIADARRG